MIDSIRRAIEQMNRDTIEALFNEMVVEMQTIRCDVIDAGSITADLISWGLPAEHRCAVCGDVLPDGAAHCIACGASTGNTGETTRLNSAGAPMTGKTVKLS